MSKNTNLNKAKKEKNDEFYTQLSDIEKEIKNYKKHFKDKVVFCNCDDPEYSEFYKYFSLNFEELGLKKLICTHYDKEKPTYKIEIEGDINGDGKIDGDDIVITRLLQNGDFRSDECIELLKSCDIVVTNPPFSLFREYIAQLINYNKKFLVIGRCDAVNYKEFFKYIKNNLVWAGYNGVSEFRQPDGSIKKFGNIGWWTNLDHNKRHEPIILWQKYYDDNGKPLPDVNERYPHYDNYSQAININKVKDIPCDYFGIMGVPNTFTGNICPEQFEIIGCPNSGDFPEDYGNGMTEHFISDYYKFGNTGSYGVGHPFLSYYTAEGIPKIPYSRVLIKRKMEDN